MDPRRPRRRRQRSGGRWLSESESGSHCPSPTRTQAPACSPAAAAGGTVRVRHGPRRAPGPPTECAPCRPGSRPRHDSGLPEVHALRRAPCRGRRGRRWLWQFCGHRHGRRHGHRQRVSDPERLGARGGVTVTDTPRAGCQSTATAAATRGDSERPSRRRGSERARTAPLPAAASAAASDARRLVASAAPGALHRTAAGPGRRPPNILRGPPGPGRAGGLRHRQAVFRSSVVSPTADRSGLQR